MVDFFPEKESFMKRRHRNISQLVKGLKALGRSLSGKLPPEEHPPRGSSVFILRDGTRYRGFSVAHSQADRQG
jgi:hypothetical protein